MQACVDGTVISLFGPEAGQPGAGAPSMFWILRFMNAPKSGATTTAAFLAAAISAALELGRGGDGYAGGARRARGPRILIKPGVTNVIAVRMANQNGLDGAEAGIGSPCKGGCGVEENSYSAGVFEEKSAVGRAEFSGAGAQRRDFHGLPARSACRPILRVTGKGADESEYG
jgi:hypothetical protein